MAKVFLVVFGYFFFCVCIGVTLHSSSSSFLDLQIYPPHISGCQPSAGIASQGSQTCSHVSVSFAAVAFHLSLPGFSRLSALCSCLWTRPLFFLASYTSLGLPSFTLPFYNCLTPLSEHSQQLSHKWLHKAQTVNFLTVFFALGNSECNLPPLYCMSLTGPCPRDWDCDFHSYFSLSQGWDQQEASLDPL